MERGRGRESKDIVTKRKRESETVTSSIFHAAAISTPYTAIRHITRNLVQRRVKLAQMDSRNLRLEAMVFGGDPSLMQPRGS